jgi:tetratricopeptide (TPR) repeat protein
MKKNVYLFVIIATGTALVFGTGGCSAGAKKARHEARGDKYFAAGQFDKAEIEYLNVLHYDHENAKAFTRLAGIYFDQGRFQTAAPFLARAVTLATNDLDLRFKFGQVLAASGDFGDAQSAAKYILDHDPKSADAPILLVQTVRTAKESAAVRAELEKLESSGNRAACETALGTLALQNNDPGSAEKYFNNALAADPKFAEALASLAMIAQARNDLKTAEAEFKAASDASPARSTRRMLYARFKMQTGDAAGATAILQDVLKTPPDYLPALLGLGEIALAQNNFDDCLAAINKILARDPDNFDGLMLSARLKFAQRDLGGSILTLERLTKLYPQSPRGHFQLGAVYFANGDDDKAVVSLNRALELEAGMAEATMVLAQIQLKNQNPDPAIASLATLTKQQPLLLPARLLLADAYRERGRLDEALAIYAELEKALPDNPQIPLLAGANYVQLGDSAHAHAEFNRAFSLSPTNFVVLEQMVNLDLSEKNFQAAMNRVQSRLQQSPNLPALNILVARIQIAQGDRAAAEKTLTETARLYPADQNAPLLLAQTYLDDGRTNDALQEVQAITEKNPKNLAAMMLQATMNENSHDYKAAAATYNQMLELDPKCTPALNNLAWLDAEYLNQLDRAAELAQRARDLMPFDPSTADTLGWIFFRRGEYPSAAALLQEAAAKMPAVPEVQYHLGMAYYMIGNLDAAGNALQSAMSSTGDFKGRDECGLCLALLNINPKSATAADREKLEQRIGQNAGDPVAQGKLAAIYQRDGNFEKAVAGYEAVLKADAKNYGAMVNLALLWEGKDPAKAYDYAKSAYKNASTDTLAAQLYGRLAYENGDYKLADSMLQPLAQSQPGNATLQFDYACATYAEGNVPAAQTALQNSLAGNLTAAQKDEAGRMADLIAAAGDLAAAKNATARVAEILQRQPDYVPALMVQAKTKELAGDTDAAAAACEKILSRFADFAPAQRELAILYSRNPQKIAQGYTLGMKARDRFPDDPALAKAVGMIVFQQGDFARAAVLLRTCAVQSPGDAEVFYYLGAAELKLSHRTAAKSDLEQAITLKLPAPLADSARQMLAGLK